MDSYLVTPTRQDVIAAQTLYLRLILGKPLRIALWVGVGVLVSGVMSRHGLSVLLQPLHLMLRLGLMLAVYGVAWLLLPPLIGWFSGSRQYRTYPALRRETHIRIGETGLEFTSGEDRWTHPWRAFIDIARNDKVTLLFMAPALFVILPGSVLPDAFLDEIARQVRRHGKAG